MNDIYELIPKDKSDDSNIKKLALLSDEEIAPILLPLLTFIQDMNWPVAKEILPVLAKHQYVLNPLIAEILEPAEKDDIWKYWIIKKLLPMFSGGCVELIRSRVERIAKNPTNGETEEEVDIAAREYLKTI